MSGWQDAAREELAKIAEDPAAFVASLDDREAKAGPVTLPDGSKVPRLPGYRRWMWDGEFCGSIGFRWQKGTSALPPYVLGHIGYAVVPWKRRPRLRHARAGAAARRCAPEGSTMSCSRPIRTTSRRRG